MSASDADATVKALGAARRGGVLLLLGIAGLGIAAAIGTATLEEKVGLAEDPARVMMVLRTQDKAPAKLVSKGGFEVEADTLEVWGVKARDFFADEKYADEDLGSLSPEQLVMRLADERGVGHVVFEAPGERDFAGIELGDTPEELDDARWAAIAVGDLVDLEIEPVRVTVNGAPSEVVQAPGIGTLQALFAQPRLGRERESLTHNPDLKELQLQKRLEWGQAMVERVPSLEELATRVQADVAKRLQEPGVGVLELPRDETSQAGHSGGVVPLADGSALMVSRAVSLRSFDASTLDYQLGETLTLHRWSPTKPSEFERVVSFAVSEQPTVKVAERGDAFTVDTRFEKPRVWSLLREVSAEGEPGPWVFGAPVQLPAVQKNEANQGEPNASGRAARVTSDGAVAWVRVYGPGAKDPLAEFPPVPGYDLPHTLWLDADRVLVLAKAQSPAEDDMVLVGDLRRPDAWAVVRPPEVWRVPGTSHGATVHGIRLGHVAVAPASTAQRDEAPLRFALSVSSHEKQHRLFLATLLESAPKAATQVPAHGMTPARVELVELGDKVPKLRAFGVWERGDAVLVSYTPDTERGSQVRARRCRPPGEALAAEANKLGESLGWICEDHVLTRDGDVRDAAARPLADGLHVVFTTQVPVSVTDRKVTRPRWAKVE